jgi:hypothetical protein
MELGSLLLCTQEPIAEHTSEPHESSPHRPILFPKYTF